MIILGIESTCDETGAALIENGRRVLSGIVSSSLALHKKYFGVVPEVAAREQVKVIIPVIKQSLSKVDIGKVDAIAVSYGPGLIGSLLTGVETAKTLALVWKKPLIPVNHLIGHVYANWLIVDSSQFTEEKTVNLPQFPIVALIVSGGHTDLILATGHGKYKWLGGTRDDAAGESFDKVARILGLGYPGGPEIEKVASSRSLVACRRTIQLPRPMIKSSDFDFSFSGLKTAVINYIGNRKLKYFEISEIAFEFQEAVCEVLVKKTVRAAEKFKAKSIVVGGGVSANERLRLQFLDYSSQTGIPVFLPTKELSIDNAAMIAAAAFFLKKPIDPKKLTANPGLYF